MQTTQSTQAAQLPLFEKLEAAGLSPEMWGDSAGTYVLLTLADGSQISISATITDGAEVCAIHDVDEHSSWQAYWHDADQEKFATVYDSEGEDKECAVDTAAVAEAVTAHIKQHESTLTEADVLRGALSTYGISAYDGGEGGATYLVVPFNPHADEDSARLEPHFLVSSGEDAHRLMAGHDEPWSASLYDGNGDYVDTLDTAPGGLTLVEDSAHCARAIAVYIADHRRDWIAPASTGLRAVPDDISTMKYDVLKGSQHLGVILDETSARLTRGGWAAWSPKASRRDGTVGFFATKEEAALAIARTWGLCLAEAAQWRTLKGISAPFFVYGDVQDDGRVWLARDRQRLTGEPVEVVKLATEAGCRYGYTASGQRIDFGGTATKVWAA
ncbi:hypothetical protein ACFQ2B_40555 [Streptomyces stramineus]